MLPWFCGAPQCMNPPVMATCAGPLATTDCEPRQARKGAAAAVDSGAGVWLVQVATYSSPGRWLGYNPRSECYPDGNGRSGRFESRRR
jgi:hypothetical protein